MKIIEEGKLPEFLAARVRCNNCKTVFEVNCGECDLHIDQRDGNFYSIMCPLLGCGYKVVIRPETFK
jgi:hypothetical protein